MTPFFFSAPQLKRDPLGDAQLLGFDRLLSKMVFIISFALAGALLVQPLALVAGSMEHGGQVLVPLRAGAWGAVFWRTGRIIVLALRYLYRRLFVRARR